MNHSQSSRPWLGGILALVALAGAAWLLRPRPVARDAVTVAAAPAPAEVARSAPVAAEPQRSPVLVEPAASSVPSAPPAPISAPPAPNAELTVAGRVLDELDVPLAEFTVRAERVGRPAPGSRSPVSARFRDAGGRFELRGLAPGEWELSARANGHASSPPRIVALPADESIELVVARQALVRGLVLDARGAPVAHARVSAEQGTMGRQRLSRDGNGTTDASGRFVLAGLLPGRTELVAHLRGSARSAPLVVRLAAGQELDDIVLELRAAATIAGEVRSPIQGDTAGVVVWLRSAESGDGLRTTETAAEGRFEVAGLPVGAYRVGATLPSGLQLGAEVVLEEGVTARALLQPPAPVVRMHGTIRIGGTAASAVLSAAADDGRPGPPVVVAPGGVRSDDSGAYALALPGAGRYRLHIGGGFGTSSFGCNMQLDAPAAAEFVHDVDVPLAWIVGRVTDEAGAPLVGVWVSSRGGALRDDGVEGTSFAETDGDGRYALPVIPGTRAVEAGDPGRERVHVLVAGLVLAAGERREGVDLVLAAGGVLAGRVRLADGRPAAGAKVWRVDGERRDGSPRSSWLGCADESGRFRVVGLEGGTILVGAGREDAVQLEPVRVEVEAGATGELELVLVPATRATVRVRDRAGRPVVCDLTLVDGGGRAWPVNSNGAGDAEPGPFPAGRYTLRAAGASGAVERAFVLEDVARAPEFELVLE